jgi:hypothetical protein
MLHDSRGKKPYRKAIEVVIKRFVTPSGQDGIMRLRQIAAVGMAVALASVPMLAAQQGAATVTLSGIAKKEAKKPYTDFTTRARNVQTGEIAGTATNQDPEANFTISGLPPANYMIELLNKQGTVICTEGPYNMTGQQLVKNDIDISCNKVPVAWWLLGAAAAAGITAGVVVANASAAQ